MPPMRRHSRAPPTLLRVQREQVNGIVDMDWFERLTGFRESQYEATKAQLEYRDGVLTSKANGRSFATGRLETPTLAELRERASAVRHKLSGTPRVSILQGDVRALHAQPELAGALFQVASQFNLLEMTAPHVRPEDGVTRYENDPTQGPACAIAAGAATIYRNYFVPVDGGEGQTAERQIDCLRDVGEALGNAERGLWKMRNGYALCTKSGLAKLQGTLSAISDEELEALKGKLRIGLHRCVGVTEPEAPQDHRVSQAFCSALPVAYGVVPASEWEPFARVVLEAAYEATFCAAAINAAEGGTPIVLLTRLGGGAFGNETQWIHEAMSLALAHFADVALDVRIVSYSHPESELVAWVESLGS